MLRGNLKIRTSGEANVIQPLSNDFAVHIITCTDIHAPGRFEPEIPSSKQPQTRDLDCVATAVGWSVIIALV
jgi:hypothetical protein